MSGGNCVIEWPRFEKKMTCMLAYVENLLYLCAEKRKMNAESNSHHIIHPFKYHAYGTIAFL